MNEFANNAFKFFHINIPSTVQLADETYNVTEEFRLSDLYGVTNTLPDKYNSFLRGLLRQEQINSQVGYSGEVVFRSHSRIS